MGSAEERPLELADFENSPNSASLAPPGPQDAQEQRNEARRRMLEYFAARLPRAAKEARSAAPLPLSLADVVEQRILSSGQLPIPDAPSVLGYVVQNCAKQVENARAARGALVLRLQRSGPVDARADLGGLLKYA